MRIPRAYPAVSLSDITGFAMSLLFPEQLLKASFGNPVKKLEKDFAARYSFPRGVAVSRARIAFYLLLKHMKLKKGGEVIIAGINLADIVNMVHLAGFVPVAADLKKDSYEMDINDLKSKINKNTSLILVTHFYGYPNGMEQIVKLAKSKKIPVVEDCSQAFSTTIDSKMLGTFGDASFFSFSLLKPISTFTGGFILSKNKQLLENIRKDAGSYKNPSKISLFASCIKHAAINLAVSRPFFQLLAFPALTSKIGNSFARKFMRSTPSIKLRNRMPENFLVNFSQSQALLALSQLKSLDKREKILKSSGDFLAHANSRNFKIAQRDSSNFYWQFPVLADSKQKLRCYLARHGIDSGEMLLSLLQDEKAFSNFNFNCKNAPSIKDRTVFIPLYYGIKKSQLGYIARVLKKYGASQ